MQLLHKLQRSQTVKNFQIETYCCRPKKQIPFRSSFEKRFNFVNLLSVDFSWELNFANLAKICENSENFSRKQFLSLRHLILFKVTLLTNEHHLNYWNFHARKQVVPRDGNAEECGVKVNLFKRKSYRVKGGRADTFLFGKKVHK